MNLEKFMLPCLSKTLFGIECLGCGFQRALLLLFQGEFLAAFKMYPAIYTMLLFLGFAVFYYWDASKKNKKTLWVLTVINIVFMIGGYYYKHFYL